MAPPDPGRAADLALLTDEARAAGEIARRLFRADVETWEKPAGAGPVTEADIAIDRMLKAELTRARPDYGWLSEETEDTPGRTEHEKIFIVDPIDGTRAFMRGNEGFCHALAVAEKGEITVAVAYFPIRDEMYWAVKGAGAFLDGAPLHVSARTEIEGAAALASAGQMKPARWPGGPPPVRQEFLNSLVWRHCLTASGRFDLAFTLRPAWEWDVAAGALIATEAGAAVTTAEGGPWLYNAPHPRMPGVVVGPTRLHAAIMQRLRPAK